MIPNLPALSPYYTVQQIAVTPDPFAWVPLLPADPTRWYMLLIDTPGAGGLVALQPDNTFTAGRVLPFGGELEFEFSKWGSGVGDAWWFYGKGGANPITVFTVSIRVQPQPLKPKE